MMERTAKSTLTRIKNKKIIAEPLIKLLYCTKELSVKDEEFLYSIAFLLIAEYEDQRDTGKDFTLYLEFAYYIIAKTSFITGNFKSLYDFTLNIGFYPIARKIFQLELIDEISFNHLLSNFQIDEFQEKNKVLTYEQKHVFHHVLKSDEQLVSLFAPTSYGKSELIFSHLKKYDELNFIAIIVPTKALINQVYLDARKRIKDRKIIIHDQAFNEKQDKRVLAIVTQERGLRLLEEGLIFDVIYIDEAHELLHFNFGKKYNNRSLLLTRFISISRAINPQQIELYLSPIINSSESIKIKSQPSIEYHSISKNLKILDISLLEKEKVYKFNRYLGEFIDLNIDIKTEDYIISKSKEKNLHFLYRPKDIESYSEKLFKTISDKEENVIPQEIEDLIIELKEIVHPKYKLNKYLSKGIVYLHGKMPNNIRNYLLKFVKENSFLKHFVANSVILAGMNLPIDNLFYISGNSNVADLHNLIGRVNRLNEIFSEKNNSIEKIFIPVHFIELSEYPQTSGGSMRNKILKLRGSFKDEVKNPMLENADVKPSNKEKAIEIQKYENDIISDFSSPSFKSQIMRAGAQQILNYTEIGLIKLEKRIKNYSEIKDDEILDNIKDVFFSGFTESDFKPEFNVSRLKNKSAINYYKGFIFDLHTKTMTDRVENLVKYWKSGMMKNSKIYIGTQFGEISVETENYRTFGKAYVDINDHINDDTYLYNLAIIKLQIDEDFLSYEISLLLNTMYEFGLISQIQFDNFMYGTNDEREIKILQLGVSRHLFRCLKFDLMLQNIDFDQFGNAKANLKLMQYINNQTGITKFELEELFF